MNFIEAVQEMQKGKRVKSNYPYVAGYLKLDDEGCFIKAYSVDRSVYRIFIPTVELILSNDWEVLE